MDLKTTENRPPSEVHKNQLRLYALTAERLGYEPVALYIDDLDSDDGGRLEVPYDHRARDAFREQLLEAVAGIEAGRFEPAAEAGTCAGCDFGLFCRYAPAGPVGAVQAGRR